MFAKRYQSPSRLTTSLEIRRKIHTTLEVERKFNITAASRLRSHLDITCSDDPQTNILPNVIVGALEFSRKPDQYINDQYFDTSNSELNGKGIWVRRRQTRPCTGFPAIIRWEAKVRMGGDFLNSEFEELEGEQAIAEYLKPINMYNLKQIVNIDTMRQNWMVLEKQKDTALAAGSAMGINLVVDASTAGENTAAIPFRHVVGELELTKSVKLSGDEEKDIQKKKEDTRKMNRELKQFMKRHEALFPTNPAPVGKLTAYFAWRRQVEEQLKQ